MVHDYAEDLLKSMKIVAEYCFNDQHFDETLICTIVDNQDAKNGHYIVSDGTIKFDAYSDIMDYKINDAVRVTILKGDYTQKKYITGKSVSENMSQPLTYVAPSDTVLDMTNNIFNRKGSWGTMANGGEEKQLQCIWSANLNDEQFKHIQTSSIYDAIILKADFKTLLGQYNLVKGSFGLRLDMYISTSSDHSTGILKRGYLDSSDMFGDFYNFVVYTNQEAKFNINQDEIIHTMSLYLYENEDFYNQDDSGNYQKIDPLAELLKIDNILVSNIYIGFGTNLINVEDNRLVITTEDDLNYNLDNSLVHNYKNIKLVWYNKDDNNKYIGFSDGRVSRDGDKIIDYDEKEYLDMVNEHQLYVKQLGKEDVPNDLDGLKLSSYLEKIKSPLSQLTQLIDRDLTQEIKRFRSRLQGIHNESNNEEIQIFGQALSNIKDTLTAFEKAKEDILITNLENSLKCAAAVQRGKGAWSDGKYVENEITYEPGTVKSLSDAIANVNKALSDIHTTVMQNLLPQTRSLILSRDPAYIGSYNNYNDRLSAILKQLEQQKTILASIIEVSVEEDGDLTFEIYKILNNLISKDDPEKFEEYNIVDEENKLKDYNNKYSIYWYYYNPIGGNDPNDPFVDENWQLLKSQAEDIEVLDLTDSVTLQNENSNIGLPEIIDSKDEYYPATGSGDHSVAKIILLPNNSIEKIKAVLVYNHEAFTSNEITFTNANPSVDIELIDNIVIEHGNYSMPTYAKYGVDNTLISLSDQSQCRELILNYYTEHGALDNSQLQDATIYWYMPAASTMLKVAKNLNISSEDEEGFIPEIATAAFNVISPGNTITRLERTEIRTINDNKYIYQGVVYAIGGETPSGKTVEEKDGTVAIKETIDVQGSTFEFQGKTYRIDGRNVIDSDEKKYTIKNNIVNLPLLFNATESEYHRDGFICYQKRITDFVNDNKFYYQIEDYYSSAFTNNTIYCKIVKGNAKLEASIELNFSTFGSNGTDYSLIIKPFNSSGALIPTMSKNEEDQQYSYDFEVNLYDYDNNPVDLVKEQHNVSVEIIGSQESYGSGSYNDGTYSNIITTYCKIDNKPISYRVLKVDVNVKIDPSEEKSDRVVLLSAYRPIPYAASDNLRYQGPTTIIYDSSGANPSYYKGLLKLFEFDESSGDLKELNDVDWEIEYYDDEGAKIEELTGIVSSYMPTIKSDKTLAPSVMYLTNANCNPVLLAKRNDIVWWAQPIYISQNRYASPMLNNWDNKLTIDEKNGTILSNFVGAGIKTENNSFSGVLMGKIEAATGIEIDGADDDLLTRSLATNHTGIGLYGFNEGTQSFGFNINGTAFLGKSGGGRISFDGNHGFIYSQNWLNSFKQYSDTKEGNYNIEEKMEVDGKTVTKYWNGRYDNPFVIDKTGNVSLSSGSKDGMAIDLQNGHIDAYNFKLTSKGIQLNSNPNKKEYYVIIGEDPDKQGIAYCEDGTLTVRTKNLYIGSGDSFGDISDAFIMQDGKMHINTSSIAAGILYSKNWQGKLTFKDTEITREEYNKLPSDKQSQVIVTEIEQGTCIDLNNGKVWSTGFTFESENSNNGSYLKISGAPCLELFHSKGNGEGVKLLEINANDFILRSKNYKIIESSTVRLIANELNVRKKPGTAANNKALGQILKGTTSKVLEIQSINGVKWYRMVGLIDTEEEQWVCSTINGLSSGAAAWENVNGKNEDIVAKEQSGSIFDMGEGYLKLQHSNDNTVLLDVTQTTYPLQIGKQKNNYRTFNIGWDGSIKGGTSYPWNITADGQATFNYLVANSGGSIGGWTITSNQLSSGSSGTYIALNSKAYDKNDNQYGEYVFWAGNPNPGNATFAVKKDGTLKATSADLINCTLSGTLNGATGTFAGSLSAATGSFTGEILIKPNKNSSEVYFAVDPYGSVYINRPGGGISIDGSSGIRQSIIDVDADTTGPTITMNGFRSDNGHGHGCVIASNGIEYTENVGGDQSYITWKFLFKYLESIQQPLDYNIVVKGPLPPVTPQT